MRFRLIGRLGLALMSLAALARAQGPAPSFALSYVLPSDQNIIPLPPGGVLAFPSTVMNTTAQAALNISNVGSASGIVRAVSISGNAFRLAGLPLFPVSVAAGQTLQLQVQYRPVSAGSDTGQIVINFEASSATINLQGNGVTSTFTYQVQTDPPATVTPGGTIRFPDTTVGQTSTLVLHVLNSGNASATISSINIAGQAFQLNNVALPQILAPNASLSLTVTFAPSQPATLTGGLTINSDAFTLTGVGLGSRLAFSYVTGDSTVIIDSNNTSVVFSPVMISSSSQVSFRARNTGTAPATISNIGVGQTNSPFSLSGLPVALPIRLAPGADLSFTIRFTPTALGFANGTLQIDTTAIGLLGSGTEPPPLPAYTIVGPSGTVAPLSQPRIGLTLSNPYPVAVTGTLTLTVAGDLPADPAVQFSTGGRTVPFVIPANTTDAQFGGQGTRIGLQSGTVASTITLTPAFGTQAGNVDLTPVAPPTLQFTVAPAAPTLVSIQVGNQTANGFTLGVTGFTTPRTLTSWTIQFTPKPGIALPVSQLRIDLQQAASLWFQRTASQAFGGLFAMTIPITFSGTPADGQTLVNSIASVSATVENALGASNSVQIAVQ